MSAISGPAQENLDFYTGVLGLRLVKLTVNYDDPTAYHLYYGDGLGNPGTLLTFFPYPDGHPGRPGAGQATVTQLAIPRDSMSYWIERFRNSEVDFDRPTTREGKETVRFRAPDGLLLELTTERSGRVVESWPEAPVPPSKAIIGIAGITLVERGLCATRNVLEGILGFRYVGELSGRHRFQTDSGSIGQVVDIVVDPEGLGGRQGHGSVHHIAFRVADADSQAGWKTLLAENGLTVSPVMDRNYFHSIYFREPGGVLFEIATDSPGFLVDETKETLGRSLRLPPHLQESRSQIARNLPRLEFP